MVGKETNLSFLNYFSIIKKIRIVKTEYPKKMNFSLDIYMFFYIMIIVLTILISWMKGFSYVF